MLIAFRAAAASPAATCPQLQSIMGASVAFQPELSRKREKILTGGIFVLFESDGLEIKLQQMDACVDAKQKGVISLFFFFYLSEDNKPSWTES